MEILNLDHFKTISLYNKTKGVLGWIDFKKVNGY